MVSRRKCLPLPNIRLSSDQPDLTHRYAPNAGPTVTACFQVQTVLHELLQWALIAIVHLSIASIAVTDRVMWVAGKGYRVPAALYDSLGSSRIAKAMPLGLDATLILAAIVYKADG